MGDKTIERYAAASGLVFAVLLLIRTLVLSPKIPFAAGDSELGKFYADNGHALALQVFLTGLIVVIGTIFFASLRGYMVRRGASFLANVMFAGWILQGSLAVVRHSFLAVPVLLSPARNIPEVTTFVVLAGIMLGFVWFSTFIIAAATSIASSRNGVLPAWFGWLTAAAAVVFLLGGLVVSTPTGFFSQSGNFRWIVLYTYIGWTAVTSLLLFQALGSEER